MRLRSAVAASLWLLVGTASAAPVESNEALLGRLDLARSGAPVEVSADRLEFDYQQRILVYEGGVVVQQGDIELRTDRLSIMLEGIEDLRLRSVVAQGNVVLTQGQRRATGGKAVFDEREKTVVLSINAVLQDGPNRVSGESIVVDLGLERSVVQGGAGRVQAVLYPPTPAPEEDEPAADDEPAVEPAAGGADE